VKLRENPEQFIPLKIENVYKPIGRGITLTLVNAVL
jgi:hypothetical protein